MSHTSWACNLHPGAAVQGKASQRSAEHGGSSQEPLSLPREGKQVMVCSELVVEHTVLPQAVAMLLPKAILIDFLWPVSISYGIFLLQSLKS